MCSLYEREEIKCATIVVTRPVPCVVSGRFYRDMADYHSRFPVSHQFAQQNNGGHLVCSVCVYVYLVHISVMIFFGNSCRDEGN